MEQERPDVQVGFRKERDTLDLIPIIVQILECSKDIQKKDSLYFRDYSKAFDCMDHGKPWVDMKEMGVLQSALDCPDV